MMDALSLNVGEKVGVTRGMGLEPVIQTVARKTATQIILDDGSKFNKRGARVGQGVWTSNFLIPVDDAQERIQSVLQKRAFAQKVNKIRNVRWSEVSEESLDAILAILAPSSPPERQP